MLEALRDRRTILVVVLLPILIYPILLLGTNKWINSQVEKIQKKKIRIVLQEKLSDLESTLLQENENFQILYTQENLKSHIFDQKAEFGISVSKNFFKEEHKEERPNITVYYSQTNEIAKLSLPKIQATIKNIFNLRQKANLEKSGMPFDIIHPFEISIHNVDNSKDNLFFGRYLILLLIIMAISFSFYPAIDMGAGEKERGTMETLLLCPTNRMEIVLAKYFAVFTIALVGSLLNLSSMGITFNQVGNFPKNQEMHTISKIAVENKEENLLYKNSFVLLSNVPNKKDIKYPVESNFSLSPSKVLTILFGLLPLIGLFSAIALALSFLAQSVKEAQSYITPMLFISMPFTFAIMIPGISLNNFLAIVPITGFVLLYRDILLDQFQIIHLVLVFLSHVLYSILALILTGWLFNQENVLFGQAKQKWIFCFLKK